MEDALEIQVRDLAVETQVLDDIDGVENKATQLLDDCDNEIVDTDGEATDGTEILDDIEEFSDHDCVIQDGKQDNKGFGTVLNDLVNEPHSSELDVSTARLLDKGTPESHPGSARRDFTSIRAAALRASGLAARSVAFGGNNSESYSFQGDCQSLKQQIAEDGGTALTRDSSTRKEVDHEDFQGNGNEQMKGVRSEKKCRFGSTTARRLFMDEPSAEIVQPNCDTDNVDGGDELPQLPPCGNEIAGLSYVDSQEPGESSQANALNFVDQYLEFNVMNFDQEVDIGKSTGGKSKPVSSAKRAQCLAKRNYIRDTAGQRGIFDWDDSHEDEGGGEFFTKMKEELFHDGVQRQISFAQTQKLRHVDLNGRGAVDKNRDREKQQGIQEKVKGLVNSTTGLVIHNLERNEKTKVTEAKSKRHVTWELDEQLKIGSSNITESTDTGKHMEEMPDVGFDTQVAAEAMEALYFGLNEADHNKEDANRGIGNAHDDASKGEKDIKVQSKRGFIKKRPRFSDSGISKRKSKETNGKNAKLRKKLTASSEKQAKNIKKQFDSTIEKPELMKAKSNGGRFAIEWPEKNDKAPNEKQAEDERALTRNKIDVVGMCDVIASTRCMTVKKRHLQEKVDTYTPIACRTRQCRAKNQVSDEIAFDDFGEASALSERRKKSITASAMLSDKGKISKLDSAQSGEVENVKMAERGKSHPNIMNMVEFGNLSYKKGIRTRRKLSGLLNCCDKLGSVNQFAGQDGARLEVSSGDRSKLSDLVATTPLNFTSSASAASPICMGDEYQKQSCRKNLSRSSFVKEITSLICHGSKPTFTIKDSRRRRDMASVQVLFSHHLDDDIIKQQKKILVRFGASEASTISDSTHFITDKFVRTKNMLEAIAYGKPVVTHLWLESCGQASCFIDERNYILRDAKKEKEFGFSLPVSLARASQQPLLLGKKVLITPNTKPGKEILASLVKAVQGLAMERIGRSAFKDDNIPEDLLVLTCEEDYEMCVPFLEKGAGVYSSELLLNGIVTQKLEYERHRLFADYVKRTRSTVWLKQDDNHYLPITKCK
ncbi:hypothetical protein NMG60_11029782 [Bertholletia excelsa]